MTTNEPPEYPDYGSVPNQGGTPPPPPPPGYPAAPGGYGPPPPGYPPMGAPGGYPQIPQTSQKATWAMILGILSVLCCGPAGIASIIMGSQAKKQIAASGGTLTGSGQAQAGFVLGIIGVALMVLVIAFYVVLAIVGFSE